MHEIITTNPATTSPLLNDRQTAEILGISPKSLAVWRCTKRHPDLKYIKVGRAVRYRPEDIESFINSRTI